MPLRPRAWLCALSALMLLPTLAMAQPDLSRRMGHTVAETGAPGYRFQTLRLASADGARHYRLWVAIPTAKPAHPRPVAWLLDGNAALMETEAALLTALARAPDAPVIVYLGYDNDLRISADARAFDDTPLLAGKPATDVIAGRRNGGADAFASLIATRAMPAVATLANVDRHRQWLWGHSYAGLFALHVAMAQPGLFAHYTAVDPALWWGEGEVLKRAEGLPHFATPAPVIDLWTGDGAPRPATPAAASAQPAGASTTPTAKPDSPAISASPAAAAAKPTASAVPAGAVTASHPHAAGEAVSKSAPAPGQRSPGQVAAMQQARQAGPPDAAPRTARALQAAGAVVQQRHLNGSHGQTLGASVPMFLRQVAGLPVEPAVPGGPTPAR